MTEPETQKPIDYLTLYGDPDPSVVEKDKTICLIVGVPCICWDRGECKRPEGRCDGE